MNFIYMAMAIRSVTRTVIHCDNQAPTETALIQHRLIPAHQALQPPMEVVHSLYIIAVLMTITYRDLFTHLEVSNLPMAHFSLITITAALGALIHLLRVIGLDLRQTAQSRVIQ